MQKDATMPYPTNEDFELDFSLKCEISPLIRSSSHTSHYHSHPSPSSSIYQSHNLPYHFSPTIFSIICQQTQTTTYLHSQTLEIIEITYTPKEMPQYHTSTPEIGPLTTIWWPL